MLTLEEVEAGRFFWALQHYQPLCNREGVPALLTNKGWTQPFTCFAIINVITAVVVWLIHTSTWEQGQLFVWTSLSAILLVDCSYLLAQFVNPGIVHHKMVPANPTQEIVNCKQCGTFSEKGTATHCSECGVCILDLDHHCGWLGRCIGSYNKGFFNAFLLFAFGLWVNFIVTAVYALDRQ